MIWLIVPVTIAVVVAVAVLWRSSDARIQRRLAQGSHRTEPVDARRIADIDAAWITAPVEAVRLRNTGSGTAMNLHATQIRPTKPLLGRDLVQLPADHLAPGDGLEIPIRRATREIDTITLRITWNDGRTRPQWHDLTIERPPT